MRAATLSLGLALIVGCGGGDGGSPDAGGQPRCDDPPGPFAAGDATGHADPLGSAATEARAGRLSAAMIAAANGPEFLTWQAGDFVLANDRVALVIEDVGHSDLYDPWGGRPVGLARVEAGALVAPADFGEQFFMTGRSTIVTTTVTVLNDGSDGNAAVVRATGRLAPIPFLSQLLGALYFDDLRDVEAALDYSLAPGSDVVEITMHMGSPRAATIESGAQLHGFMFTPRMPPEVPGRGFTDQINGTEWVQFVADDTTSWAYRSPDGTLGSSIAMSGFIGAFSPSHVIAACDVTDHHHADLLIGAANGLDGLEVARARHEDRPLRAITGTVSDGSAPLGAAHVHAVLADGAYLTRATTNAAGEFTLHVPADDAVTLTAYRRGWQTATLEVAAADTVAAITVPASGIIDVVAVDEDGLGLPVRVQVLPSGASTIPEIPDELGEEGTVSGRLAVQYPTDGQVSIVAPAGSWRVVVSRGYEYDLTDVVVDVTAGNTTNVAATLTRVVDTTDVQCGDFHIHTRRSNDSGDDPTAKVRSAVADGLELPVRTEHEWVANFQSIIDTLGVQAWAFGIGSIEMTSFQIWGHMGVFPLDPDATKPNAGAPIWQSWPTAESPDVEVVTKSPVDVFDEVRARPEAPSIIINHPRGSSDYFSYAGLDAVTGDVMRPEVWDEEFKLVEVFNDSSWLGSRNGTVTDWFALLSSGRKVFAIGSSDSHGINGSPVGYPRTCIALGTDTPGAADASAVRDALDAGHATISGGVYVDATVGTAGPGDTATGTTGTAQVAVRIQAATWIDVDSIDVVVNGVTTETIAILPADADPGNPVIRWQGTIDVPVSQGGGYVVIAAYGDSTLEPVHPGRVPFGVTNPIFLVP